MMNFFLKFAPTEEETVISLLNSVGYSFVFLFFLGIVLNSKFQRPRLSDLRSM